MAVDIDNSNLPEKLKQIRERSGLTWDEFAQQVSARDGTDIAAYENNEGDLPISVLYAYARFARIPVENIVDDDRRREANSITAEFFRSRADEGFR